MILFVKVDIIFCISFNFCKNIFRLASRIEFHCVCIYYMCANKTTEFNWIDRPYYFKRRRKQKQTPNAHFVLIVRKALCQVIISSITTPNVIFAILSVNIVSGRTVNFFGLIINVLLNHAISNKEGQNHHNHPHVDNDYANLCVNYCFLWYNIVIAFVSHTALGLPNSTKMSIE